MNRHRVKFHSREQLQSLARGFTLTELLIVIAVIGVLAALLLPALGRARAQADRITCLNNTRQIGLAMLSYLGENRETFPAANIDGLLVPEDWIYYDGVDPTAQYFVAGGDQNAIKKSPIVRYTGFGTNLFRCPTDSFLRQLDLDPAGLDVLLVKDQIYRFSYTLNAGGQVGVGMASTISPADPTAYFRASSISRPSMKIMMAEKQTGFEATLTQMLNWGRGSGWFWTGYPWEYEKLTGRHVGRGNQSFADGHAESLRPELGLMPQHCDPRQ